MEKLYNEEILKHAKTPQFASKVKKIAASGHAVNQFCGDEVDVELSFSKGVINDVYINSKGCSINIASSSLMAGEIKNLDPNQVATLINNYKSFMDGKTVESKYKKKYRFPGSDGECKSVPYPNKMCCFGYASC